MDGSKMLYGNAFGSMTNQDSGFNNVPIRMCIVLGVLLQRYILKAPICMTLHTLMAAK